MLSNTFTNLDYYVDILNSKLRTSIKFFVVSYLLITLGLTINYAVKELPLVQQDIDSIKNELLAEYPADLSINWDGNQLAVQPDEPITIPYPQAVERPEEFPQSLGILNFNQPEPDQSVSALFVVGAETVWVNSFTQGWSDTSLREVLGETTWTVNREVIDSSVPTLAEEFKRLSMYFPVLYFFFTIPALILSRLFSLAIDAFILHFIFLIQRKSIPYLKTLQLALHIMVPVEVIHQVTRLSLPDLNFPMLTVGFWALAFLLVWHFRSLHVFPEQK